MRGLPPALARLTAVLAAGVIVVAFFLPWMDGEGEFRYRAFSGFDFARLIRNFEITAASPSDVGQVRAPAIALYLVPALAVNAAVFCGLVLANGRWTSAAGLASVTTAIYTITVLGALLAFSALPVTDLADVIGPPVYGLAMTGIAALTMGVIGVLDLWRVGRR
jgi:hypothetical protein